MAKKLYEEANIQDVANAIRAKNGTQDSYTVEQMGDAIRDIEMQPDLEVLSVNKNGTYLPSNGKDGFSSVSVNVSGGGETRLPAEYQEVEYVECYGNEWCDINSSGGLFINDIIELEMSLGSDAVIANEAGFIGHNGNPAFEIYISNSGHIEFYQSVSGISYHTGVIERDTKYTISAKITNTLY